MKTKIEPKTCKCGGLTVRRSSPGVGWLCNYCGECVVLIPARPGSERLAIVA